MTRHWVPEGEMLGSMEEEALRDRLGPRATLEAFSIHFPALPRAAYDPAPRMALALALK